MANFIEQLQSVGTGKVPVPAALTFLSDLSTEDRTTFRGLWQTFQVERRRRIVETLADMAEDNIELYFRPVFLATLEDGDAQVRLSSIEGLFEDDSKVLLGRLIDL